MFIKKFQLFSAILFSIILLSTNVFAFHKKNSKDDNVVYEDPELEEDQVKQKHCAYKIRAFKDKGSTEQVIDEKGKLGWVLTGSHSSKKIPSGKILLIGTQKNQKLKKKINHETSLADVLKIHCLQYDEKDRPIKYGKSSMEELFLKIAEKNNIIDENGNFSIKEPIGEEIYKKGITIDEPNVVYYIPDYLIASYDKIQEQKKKNKEKAEKAAKKAAEDREWVKDNFPVILEKAKKKKQKFNEVKDQLINELSELAKKSKEFQINYEKVLVDINDLIDFDVVNTKDKKIVSKLKELRRLKTEKLDVIELEVTILDGDIDKERKLVENLFSKNPVNYKKLRKLVSKNFHNLEDIIQRTNKSSKKKDLESFNKILNKIDYKNLDRLKVLLETKISAKIDFIATNSATIARANDLIEETKVLDAELSEKSSFTKYFVYAGIALLVIFGIGLVVYIFLQRKELTNLKSETKKSESRFSELQGQIKTTSEQIKNVPKYSSTQSQTKATPIVDKPKTKEEVIAEKFDEMLSDYKDSLEDFSKVAVFKQKWNGLALSRKERQDGSKTILINSSRAFEKAEIWCVNFSDKYFAFPGSSVKSNMAAYMNLDFEKASRDFKGVFAISSGSSYLSDPALLRRGGAGFVVEKPGKLIFPT